MSNIKLYNYLKMNNVVIDNDLILLQTDLLREIIKKYKLKKQYASNKKYRLAHPDKAREISKNQAYKKYHSDPEYRANKIKNEMKKYHFNKFCQRTE